MARGAIRWAVPSVHVIVTCHDWTRYISMYSKLFRYSTYFYMFSCFICFYSFHWLSIYSNTVLQCYACRVAPPHPTLTLQPGFARPTNTCVFALASKQIREVNTKRGSRGGRRFNLAILGAYTAPWPKTYLKVQVYEWAASSRLAPLV